MNRENVSSPSPWEPVVGFSRAVRVGNQVFFAGTLDTGADARPVGRTAYDQTKNIFARFERILQGLGGSMESIVRTRMYVLDRSDVADISMAHA